MDTFFLPLRVVFDYSTLVCFPCCFRVVGRSSWCALVLGSLVGVWIVLIEQFNYGCACASGTFGQPVLCPCRLEINGDLTRSRVCAQTLEGVSGMRVAAHGEPRVGGLT